MDANLNCFVILNIEKTCTYTCRPSRVVGRAQGRASAQRSFWGFWDERALGKESAVKSQTLPSLHDV